MPKIKIYPLDQTIRARRGDTVRDALARAGIAIETPCSGDGLCGKCLVCIESPAEIFPTPHKEITEEQMAEGVRLACQVSVRSDMVVRLLSDAAPENYQILEDDLDADFQAQNPESDSARKNGKILNPAIEILERGDRLFCRYEDEDEKVLQGFRKGISAKGLAIDLGTTTLVATLVSLKTGRELSTTSALNPQIRFGHDVVRRIHYGSTPEGLSELSGLIREGINRLLEQVCEDSNISAQEILDVVIGGNTTMLQLAAGIDPAPLGEVPFTVGIHSGCSYPVDRFGIDVNPAAKVYVPPVLHSYVGADISAGLLVCPGFFDETGKNLFIDIGTNGEMGLSADGRFLLTSTAAGPAFEGMGISAGMRARIGAVEGVTTDRHSIRIHTIGNAPAVGICGSGIIDLTAALFKTGVIDTSGRMRSPDNAGDLPELIAYRLEQHNGASAFHLGGDVYFTQEDVRQVQLAKSAIRAAIDILIAEAGVSPESIDRVVLAGGFGYSLRPENLEKIGLIPPGMSEKVTFAGNTCRIGCVRMLRNTDFRRFLENQMNRAEHVSIEMRPDFMEKYVEEMEFPVFDEHKT